MASAPNSLTAPPIGRPSDYSEALANEICSAVASGESVGKACAELGLSERTVYAWLARHESFQQNYARAASFRAEKQAEEIVTIADTDPDPQRARNRIDARKWIASKLLPKKYGDLQQHQVEVNHQVVIALPRPQDVQRRIEAGKVAAQQDDVIEAEIVGEDSESSD